MEDAAKSGEVKTTTKRNTRPLWVRLIHYSIRQARKRKAQKYPEPAADKAARRTANATIAIAALTLVLAIVSYFQWREIHEGSTDTHNLAVAAGNQATWTQRLATNTDTESGHMKDLADRMRDQAARTKDEADQTRVLADEAKVQANAAKSAADTARDALRISERAYVIAGAPALDAAAKVVTIPFINLGHIPSSNVTAIIHEATINVIAPDASSMLTIPIEAHWKHYALDSVPPTVGTITYSANIPLPDEDPDRINKGLQQVFTVGTISYKDGFPDTPGREWHFCEAYVWSVGKKSAQWVPCDWTLYMSQIIQFDHYPQNESQ